MCILFNFLFIYSSVFKLFYTLPLTNSHQEIYRRLNTYIDFSTSFLLRQLSCAFSSLLILHCISFFFILPSTDSYDSYHVHPLHMLFFTIAASLHVACNRLQPRDLSVIQYLHRFHQKFPITSIIWILFTSYSSLSTLYFKMPLGFYNFIDFS